MNFKVFWSNMFIVIVGLNLFACHHSVVAPIINVENYTIIYTGSNELLSAVNSDGGNNRQLDTVDAIFPTSSPNGGKIAFFTHFNNPIGSFWLATYDTLTRAHKKLALIFGQSGSTLLALSWSGDGVWLTFSKPSTQSGQLDVWKVDTSGSLLQQLTTSGLNVNPVLSPDGQTITYSLGTGYGAVGYEMNSDGSNKRPISYLPAGMASDLQWRPDGNMVSFNGKDDSSIVASPPIDIFVADVQGKTVKRITSDMHSVGARWSPDGNRLAYRSGPAGTDDVCVINPDGTGQKQLTTSGKALVGDLEWSPDSRKIAYGYFISQSAYSIHVVDVESGNDTDTGAQPRSYRFTWN